MEKKEPHNDRKRLIDHTKMLSLALKDMDHFHNAVSDVSQLFKKTFREGRKVLVAGNGGSAAQATHLSDEMMGRYAKDRPAYPVISLVSDTAVLTCIGNDYGYEEVFARQIDGLGKEGDVFVGLTTSGSSENILRAAKRAKERSMIVVALMGEGGPLAEFADIVISSPSKKSAIVQELHLHAIHSICEFFEPK